MRKEDLKSGMLARTASGFQYLVVRGTGMPVSQTADNDILIGIDKKGYLISGGWMGLDGYQENLTHPDPQFTIVEVLKARYADDIGRVEKYQTIWKRG